MSTKIPIHRLYEIHELDERVFGDIVSHVDGAGYRVSIRDGVFKSIGFLPHSLVGMSVVKKRDRVLREMNFEKTYGVPLQHDSAELVGATNIPLHIVKISSDENFVLSHKSVILEDIQRRRDAIPNTYSAGMCVTGFVESKMDYGLFISIDEGVVGMAHISEDIRGTDDDPNIGVELGDVVRAQIDEVDGVRISVTITR
jgi:ribosomal protein S1